MATPAVHREVESQDEEFLHHLRRGADLLARGELDPALASLHRARDLRPRDPQVLGLLGQTLYKQGRFDLAAEAYQRLVDESPIEASARVNLGLSHLKARRFAQAVRQFEVALDLSPGHKKAMGYLGLAWLDQGDPARARGWFERAGSSPMVTRCDELIAAAARAPERTEAPAPPAAAAPAPHPAPEPPAVADAAAPEPPAGEAPAPAAPDRAAEAPSAGPAEHAPPMLPPEAFAGARAISGLADTTFALERGILTVSVRRDVVVRAQGLLAVRGAVRLTPEMKRFRGRPTEKPFGDGERRMLRASGDGALLYAVSGSRLARFELAGEAAYYREDLVFAFEDALAFENGRVASRAGPDLHLVQLQGHGQVLLATSGDVVAVDVARDVPVRVRLAALLGWTGALTPKVGSLAKGFAAGPGADPADPPVVELAGVGRVLLDQGAAA